MWSEHHGRVEIPRNNTKADVNCPPLITDTLSPSSPRTPRGGSEGALGGDRAGRPPGFTLGQRRQLLKSTHSCDFSLEILPN